MGNTSDQWGLWAEIGGCYREIGCVDFTEIVDSTSGRLQLSGYREQSNGRPHEFARWRNYEPSTALVTIPEEAGDFFEDMRKRGCTFNLQRRLCPSCCEWSKIEFYVNVSVDNIRKSPGVSRGLNTQAGVPMLSVSLVWEHRYMVEYAEPDFHIQDGSLAGGIVDVAYCDCDDCCSGSSCSSIYRLLADGTLETLVDGSWEVVRDCLPCLSPVGLSCSSGNLWVISLSSVWYSPNPEGGEWRNYPVPRGHIVSYQSYGTNIYILTRDGDDYFVYVTRHNTLVELLERESEHSLRDIAVYGRFIVVAGDAGSLIYSTDGGVTWDTETMTTSRGVPNIHMIEVWANGGCLETLVADHLGRLWRGEPFSPWRLIFSPPQPVDRPNTLPPVLPGQGSPEIIGRPVPIGMRVFLSSGLMWYAYTDGNKVVLVRSAGDCNCWKISEYEFPCDDIEIEEPLLACYGPDCESLYFMTCCSQQLPCQEDLPPNTVLFGCTVGPISYVLRCPDDCGGGWVGWENACILCHDENGECLPGQGESCENCTGCVCMDRYDDPCDIRILACCTDETCFPTNGPTETVELEIGYSIPDNCSVVACPGQGYDEDGNIIDVYYFVSCEACPIPVIIIPGPGENGEGNCEDAIPTDAMDWTPELGQIGINPGDTVIACRMGWQDEPVILSCSATEPMLEIVIACDGVCEEVECGAIDVDGFPEIPPFSVVVGCRVGQIFYALSCSVEPGNPYIPPGNPGSNECAPPECLTEEPVCATIPISTIDCEYDVIIGTDCAEPVEIELECRPEIRLAVCDSDPSNVILIGTPVYYQNRGA